jgi:uncharacterized protein
MHRLLHQTKHRPFPPPREPWLMHMRWNDLLFAHWAFDPEAVRAVLPGVFRSKLDVYEGAAWIGLVPFWMNRVRVRWTPALPVFSTFPEMNVRTYVTLSGKAGIYFFSLDTTRLAAVIGARAIFSLNYLYARMHIRKNDEWFSYSSHRLGAPTPATFHGRYRGTGPCYFAADTERDRFLFERYCLYSVRGGRVLRGDIHHAPWEIQQAQVEIAENSLAANGLPLRSDPMLLHYAKRKDVLAWLPHDTAE